MGQTVGALGEGAEGEGLQRAAAQVEDRGPVGIPGRPDVGHRHPDVEPRGNAPLKAGDELLVIVDVRQHGGVPVHVAPWARIWSIKKPGRTRLLATGDAPGLRG